MYTTTTTITPTIVSSTHPLPEHNFEAEAFKPSLHPSAAAGVAGSPTLNLRAPWQG